LRKTCDEKLFGGKVVMKKTFNYLALGEEVMKKVFTKGDSSLLGSTLLLSSNHDFTSHPQPTARYKLRVPSPKTLNVKMAITMFEETLNNLTFDAAYFRKLKVWAYTFH
jgi:hypothetical protein